MSEQVASQRGGANPHPGLGADSPKTDVSSASATGHDTGYLRVFVFALFFFFGGITSLNDVIIPKLKGLFTLSEVMTVQSAFFGAYFTGLALTLLVLATMVWSYRNHLREHRIPGSSWREALGLLRVPRFIFGAGCIFLYVGAEVAIGSLIVSYLTQTDVPGLTQRAAGEHVPLYWGGAMVGRFIGSYHLSLASEGLGPRSASASGIIAVAIVGGAVIPPLTGHMADLFSLRTALIVPAICHVGILAYGIYTRRPATAAA